MTMIRICTVISLWNTVKPTQAMIDAAKANQTDPIVRVAHQTKTNRLYNNTLPIQRKVWDLATVILYRLHLQFMKANLDARLVRIKTDLLVRSKFQMSIKTMMLTVMVLKITLTNV